MKKTKEPRSKRAVRLLALILAIVMVAGAAYYTIWMIASAIAG